MIRKGQGARVRECEGGKVRGARVRRCGCAVALTVVLAFSGCSKSEPPRRAPAAAPNDAQHAGIKTPHGDHSPHHGGMVLMNGEMHYEVAFDRNGHHRLWFTDAVREDLPASIAAAVAMVVMRPGAPPEALALTIDDNGESWEAHGQPVAGDNVTVKLVYSAGGQPLEIEIPFVASTTP